MTPTARLAVIGNISVDHTHHAVRRSSSVGGAALHIALAAATAGMCAAPVAVIGNDLRWLPNDSALAGLDWSGVGLAYGRSAAFTLNYDTAGDLAAFAPTTERPPGSPGTRWVVSPPAAMTPSTCAAAHR